MSLNLMVLLFIHKINKVTVDIWKIYPPRIKLNTITQIVALKQAIILFFYIMIILDTVLWMFTLKFLQVLSHFKNLRIYLKGIFPSYVQFQSNKTRSFKFTNLQLIHIDAHSDYFKVKAWFLLELYTKYSNFFSFKRKFFKCFNMLNFFKILFIIWIMHNSFHKLWKSDDFWTHLNFSQYPSFLLIRKI